MTNHDPSSNAAPRALVRVTSTAPTPTAMALTAVTAVTADDQTVAVNAAQQAMATLLAPAHHDGTLRAIGPDSAVNLAHLP